MSYVYVPFDSVETLIKEFQNINVTTVIPTQKNPAANFVVITPHLYYGTYGGLIFNSVLATCAKHEYISEKIDPDTSLVWWNSSLAKHRGDLNALSIGDRVAITPNMYKQLLINPLRKPMRGKSSYYGDRAWSMKARSSSYSDSV